MNIAVITDTHITEPGLTLRGRSGDERAKALVDSVLLSKYDLVVHLGDVADSARPESGRVATEESYLNARSVFEPILDKMLFIPGNHDNPDQLGKILGDRWEHSEAGVFLKSMQGVCLVGLDCRTGVEATGYFRPETNKTLEGVCRKYDRIAMFTHYPWLEGDCNWINDGMLVRNGNSLHELLVKYESKISAVFHGHIHSWQQLKVDNLSILSTVGSFEAFCTGAGETRAALSDPRQPCGYLDVNLAAERFISRPVFQQSMR